MTFIKLNLETLKLKKYIYSYVQYGLKDFSLI